MGETRAGVGSGLLYLLNEVVDIIRPTATEHETMQRRWWEQYHGITITLAGIFMERLRAYPRKLYAKNPASIRKLPRDYLPLCCQQNLVRSPVRSTWPASTRYRLQALRRWPARSLHGVFVHRWIQRNIPPRVKMRKRYSVPT